ncbi:MAG: transposase [Chloroflexi bacterium]|nr:transposase [Chloroflexota bacterium]
MKRYTFNDFNREFPTDESCLEWLVGNRWPDGITCDKCDRVRKHH